MSVIQSLIVMLQNYLLRRKYAFIIPHCIHCKLKSMVCNDKYSESLPKSIAIIVDSVVKVFKVSDKRNDVAV